MNNKLKLARLILIETESLRECTDIVGALALAEELTRDAVALAKLIEMEEEQRMAS